MRKIAKDPGSASAWLIAGCSVVLGGPFTELRCPTLERSARRTCVIVPLCSENRLHCRGRANRWVLFAHDASRRDCTGFRVLIDAYATRLLAQAHRCGWWRQPLAAFRLRSLQAVMSRLRRRTINANTSPVNSYALLGLFSRLLLLL